MGVRPALRRGVLPVMALALLLGACGKGPPAAFEDGQAVWDAAKPADYSFTYGRSSQCGNGEMRVTVRSGVIAESGAAQLPCGPEKPATIDGLFDRLESAYERADVVEASYDSEFGFPTSVFVNEEASMFDEEWGMSITEFVVE